jgi:hypothetical protein
VAGVRDEHRNAGEPEDGHDARTDLPAAREVLVGQRGQRLWVAEPAARLREAYLRASLTKMTSTTNTSVNCGRYMIDQRCIGIEAGVQLELAEFPCIGVAPA